MIQILIVDDHAIVRMGLSKIIEYDKNLNVKAQAKSAEEAVNMMVSENFDIIILDISLPGRSGLDIIKDLKNLQPKARIIMLSMYKEKQFALRSYRAGASGYLTKEMAPEEIITAIYKVIHGEKFISTEFASILLNEIIDPTEHNLHDHLSDRELEVLRLIARGNSLIEIAASLSLSDRTVSTYRTRILEKMNYKNNAELIHYCIDNNIL